MPTPPPNKNSSERGAPEDAATQWPPKEYREWVQSQIANRMLLRFGGLGIGTLIALSASYFSLQNFVLDSVQPKIVAKVRDEIQPTIRAEVLDQLIDQSKLIENTRDKIVKEDSTVIRDLVESEEFTKKASERLIRTLDETGGPQLIILKEALNQAKDVSGSDATRALGLELYALFHDGARASPDIDPMRKTFIEILSSGSDDKPIPQRLMRVILEHYPLGEHHSDRSHTECAKATNPCVEWDREIVEIVLGFLAREPRYPTDALLFDNFFSRIPQELVDRIMIWAKDSSNSSIANNLLTAIVSSERPSVLAKAIPHIAKMAGNQDDSRLRRIGLEVLGKIDPHAKIPRTTRAEALKAIWSAAAISELEAAFSNTYFRKLVFTETARLPQVHSEVPSALDSMRVIDEDLDRRSQDPQISALGESSTIAYFRAAVISLLRTGLLKQQGSSNTNYVNDWDHVLQAGLNPNQDAISMRHAYAAWASRIVLDRDAGHQVDLAADRILTNPLPNLLTDDLSRSLTVFAVTEASKDALRNFTNSYRSFWIEQKPTGRVVDVALALIEQDGADPQHYPWLRNALGPIAEAPAEEHIDEESFRNHLLDSLGTYFDKSLPKHGRGRVIKAANRAISGLAGSPSERALSKIIISELNRRSDRNFWDIAAAVEESGLLSNKVPSDHTSYLDGYPAFDHLKNKFDWIGSPINVGETLFLSPDSSPYTLKLDNPSRASGGNWYRITLAEPLNIELEDLGESVEAVLLSSDRSTFISRSNVRRGEGVFSSRLLPGVYALSLRIHDLQEQKQPDVMLEVRRGPAKLSVVEKKSPVPISGTIEYTFDSGTSEGEVWLKASLAEGSILQAETLPNSEEGRDTDTYIGILEANSGLLLHSDDDSGDSAGHARLEFKSEKEQTVLVQVAECCVDPIGPDVQFKIQIRIANEDEIKRAGASIETATVVQLGQEIFLQTDTDHRWLRFSSESSGLFGLTHDFERDKISMIDNSNQKVIRFKSPEPADARTGDLLFFAESGRDYFFEVFDHEQGLKSISVVPTDIHFLDYAESPSARSSPLSTQQPALVLVPVDNPTILFTSSESVESSVFVFKSDLEVKVDVGIEEIGKPGSLDVPFQITDFPRWISASWESSSLAKHRVRFESAGEEKQSLPSDPLLVAYNLIPHQDYDGFWVGGRVRLGKHDELDGSRNWGSRMEKYVGCLARITELRGKDSSESYIVRVDLKYAEDERLWVWRTRNMQSVSEAEVQPERCREFSPE